MSLPQIVKFIANHPLNREHRLAAVVRFARWQLASRLVAGDVVCPWVNGSRFLARAGETGITGNIYTGLHEFADMGFLLHFLRPGDLFVDVGANVGSYTILACAAAGARGIAFEPVPATHRRLRDNVRLNGLEERVRCLNMGVGARPGRLAFTRDSDGTNHTLAAGERAANAIDVEVTSLDVALAGRTARDEPGVEQYSARTGQVAHRATTCRRAQGPDPRDAPLGAVDPWPPPPAPIGRPPHCESGLPAPAATAIAIRGK